MGYIGIAPSSVWIWQPTEVQLSDSWRTLRTEFETGWETRRAKWARPIASVSFRFERGRLTPDDVGDIWRFYKDKQGAFKSFDLPIFGRLTTIESAYSAGGFSVGLADTQDFTSSISSRWNRFYVQNVADQFDFFTVNSVVSVNHVRVQSGGANAYAVGEPVSPVIKARFADDIYSPTYMVALATTLGIPFTEVRS